MSKKRSSSGLLLAAIGAAAGGILAYQYRREIEDTVRNLSEKLRMTEEDGFFMADPDDEDFIIHAAPDFVEKNPEEKAEEKPAEEPAAESDSDFVDITDTAQSDSEEEAAPAPAE